MRWGSVGVGRAVRYRAAGPPDSNTPNVTAGPPAANTQYQAAGPPAANTPYQVAGPPNSNTRSTSIVGGGEVGGVKQIDHFPDFFFRFPIL